MQTLGMEEGVPIESRLITRQIERAQKQVEARNFEIRKHLLEYDDVMNKQREAIYAIRRDLLEGADQKEYIQNLAEDILTELMEQHAPRVKHPDEWDLDGLRVSVGNQFNVDISSLGIDLKNTTYPELSGKLSETLKNVYEDKEKRVGSEFMRYQERMIMLHVLDTQWKDHLLALDHLKEGIGLRGYGQRDPLIEYKKESFDMFEALNARREEETLRYLFFFQPVSQEDHQERARQQEEARRRQAKEHNLVYGSGGDGTVVQRRREVAKVGRNDPCPCGSGKKFKKCHGQ
jgi:preprotein translocase subunit SecA